MKKNGFTLIELISMIVILSLIALIVFPAVASIVKSSRDDAYENQKIIIEKAAKEYYLDNVDSLPDIDENGTCNSKAEVNIYTTLVDEGYIADEELVNISKLDESDIDYITNKYGDISKVILNPKNNKPLDGLVRVTCRNNQYIYEFIDGSEK